MRRFAILVVYVLASLSALPGPAEAQGVEAGLSEAQIHALAERVIAAQHADDVALEEFERTEQHMIYSGANRRITEDKFYRVVPTGTGTLKLLFKDNSAPLDPNFY